MPGFLFHVNAGAACTHGGKVNVVTSNTRVLVSGQPASTATDVYPILGCAFTVPTGKPQPCVKVVWGVPATRILINGQPAILNASAGIGQSAEQVPQGPVVVAAVQGRVTGI